MERDERNERQRARGKIEGKREATVYNQASRMREETASGLRNGVEKRASGSESESEKKRVR